MKSQLKVGRMGGGVALSGSTWTDQQMTDAMEPGAQPMQTSLYRVGEERAVARNRSAPGCDVADHRGRGRKTYCDEGNDT